MPKYSRLAERLLIFASIIIIIAGLKSGARVFGPILLAITLTVLVWPLLAYLEKKGMPRWLAIALVATTVVIAVAALMFALVSSLSGLAANIPSYSAQLKERLGSIPWMANFTIGDYIGNMTSQESAYAQATVAFVSKFIMSIFNILAFLLLLLLMIIASDRIVKKFNRITTDSTRFREDFELWSKSVQVQYRVQTLNNLISAGLMTLLFFILGIDYALLWGVLAFVLSYIPNVGLTLASIPPVALTLILKGWSYALFVVVFIIALNFIMDNIVSPRLMGKEFEIPAVYIFMSFLISSFIFGILGAFMYLPLFLAVRQLLMMDPKTRFIGRFLGADEAHHRKS